LVGIGQWLLQEGRWKRQEIRWPNSPKRGEAAYN
jgi:hypothetical protein